MTLGSLNTKRSWQDLRDELANELRKWGVDKEDIVLPAARNSREQGYVELQFHYKGEWRTVRCNNFSSESNGQNKNLAAIKESVKSARMADQRGIGAIFAEVASLIALPDPNDPFVILGVPPTKDKDVLKSAYRRRLQSTHPDKPGGSREAYARVRGAAESLGVL